jgi:ATP-binding cassette subfamily B protein
VTRSARGFDYDRVLRPERQRSLRRLPSLLVQAFALTYKAAPRTTVTFSLLQLLTGVGLALQLLAARSLLTGLLRDDAGLADVMPALIALTAVSALVSAGNAARTEQQRLLTEMVSIYATRKVIGVATSADLLAFDDPKFHDQLERARLNAVTRPVQMTAGALGVLSASFAIVGISVALLLVQPWFVLFVVAAYAPVWFAATRSGAAVYEFSVRQTPRERLKNYLFQLLTDKPNATEVRAFQLAELLRARHDSLARQRLDDLRQLVRRRLRSGLVASLLTALLVACTLVVLMLLMSSGHMTIAEAGTAAVALLLLGQRLQSLAAGAGAVYESSLFLEDVTSFTSSDHRAVEESATGHIPADWSVLEADAVHFTYPSRASPSLRGISLQVHRGEVVALVGENGSGKTTLAKVLAGLYQPQSGRVLLGGTDLSTCPIDEVTAEVGLLLQDFVRYRLSARDNIIFGAPEKPVDDERVVQAAERADAHGLLSALPEGYGTQLGPEFLGGSDLSGGQWQRVALARAFYRDAPLLILDEPTSALDARAEAALFDRIRELQRGRTVILISHRFSSVRSADRIHVLHEGDVVESGSHDELMALGGRYAELYALQAAAYGADSDARL